MTDSAIDYRYYKLSGKEKLLYGLLYFLAITLASALLFGHWLPGPPLAAITLPVFYKKLSAYLCKRRRGKLEEEFCTYMQLAAASLASGTSLENVFREVAESGPTSGKHSYMENEFLGISRLISLNYESSEAFALFAKRTGSSDIESMSDALSGVKYSGGNLVTLVRGGVEALRLKQDTEREIRRIVSAPKMNQRILTFMPFAFILLLRMMSPEYVSYLYKGWGLVVMSAVALLLVGAYFVGEKITDVKF